jgi:polysaccharide chain length determinant protein (PEP-CTERM system associated)
MTMPMPKRPQEAPEASTPRSDPVLAQLLEALADPREEKKDRMDPRVYLEIAARRRWFFILPVLCVLVVGVVLAIKFPRLYEASTLILIQAQKIPSDYVRPVVTDDLEERLNTISQQINSRSNLEKIIAEFGLYTGDAYAGMYIEDKLAHLRKHISVNLFNRSRNRDPESFTVSFRGKDPEQVMKITNRLSENFIDENLRMREAQIHGTNSFLGRELETMRLRLQELEEKLQTYRSQHMGGLPEQLETNLQMLERLGQQVNDKQAAIRDAKNRIILINQQLNDLRNMQAQAVVAAAPGRDIPMDDHTRLAVLRQELVELQSKYTDRHPDLQRTRQQIRDLEAKMQTQGSENEAESPAESARLASSPFAIQQMSGLMAQRTEAQQEIQELERDLPRIREQMGHFQQLVDQSPQREQELLSLKRDYENMTQTYNAMLSRKLEAEVAVNLENTQSGEQFRILDRAQTPSKPVTPDMRKLSLLVVFAALGLGAGAVIGMEYLDTSFKSASEAGAYLGLPVLVTLPYLDEKRSRKRILTLQALTALSVATAAGLIGVLAILTLKGVDPLLKALHRVF